MTSQKLNEEHEILRRFMAVVVSSAFENSLRKCRFLKVEWASKQMPVMRTTLRCPFGLTHGGDGHGPC